MAEPGYVRQAAAVPVRRGQVCLVTRSTGKKWVIPKGMIEPGQSAGESALQESWEEAGLVGTLDPEPIGSYVYEKMGRQHHVTVFVLRVTDAAADWPERGLRQREWVSPATAVERVDPAGLSDVLRRFAARLDDVSQAV